MCDARETAPRKAVATMLASEKIKKLAFRSANELPATAQTDYSMIYRCLQCPFYPALKKPGLPR